MSHRIQLKDAQPKVEYLFVVDERGKLWLLKDAPGRTHNELIPRDERVFCAGCLMVKPDGRVSANCNSGHYMHAAPISRGFEAAAWREAMKWTILQAGKRPHKLTHLWQVESYE